MRLLMNVRNSIDFFFRTNLPVPRLSVVEKKNDTLRKDDLLRTEIKEFMSLFNELKHLPSLPSHPTVVDIGARNFFMAPLIERFFSDKGVAPEIHGVEIDSHRRYTDLRTRADYGFYYAGLIPRSHFHPKSFLDFSLSADFAFLLNPFVTEEPLLCWGLPLTEFLPLRMYLHLFKYLAPNGLVLTSHPSEEEYEAGRELAEKAGFTIIETRSWHPRPGSSQTQPRLGYLLKK